MVRKPKIHAGQRLAFDLVQGTHDNLTIGPSNAPFRARLGDPEKALAPPFIPPEDLDKLREWGKTLLIAFDTAGKPAKSLRIAVKDREPVLVRFKDISPHA